MAEADLPPIEISDEFGWTKETHFRKSGSRKGEPYVIVKAPYWAPESGYPPKEKKLRSSEELKLYINKHEIFSQINTEIINFEGKYHVDDQNRKKIGKKFTRIC